MFHAYGRNDDGAYTPPNYLLTARGRLHATSTTGIDTYPTSREFLTAPNISNTANPAVGFNDGSGRIIIAGSTAISAGVRDAHRYFISYDGRTFVASVTDPVDARVIGYGPMHLVTDGEGRVWVVHVYEAADGKFGFNRNSTIIMRVMNMAWLLRRAVAI